MKHLDVSAPQTLSASYLIPLAAPMIGAEVQRRITRAVGTRLTGPLKTLVLQWADQGAVSVWAGISHWPPRRSRTGEHGRGGVAIGDGMHSNDAECPGPRPHAFPRRCGR